MLMRLPSVAKLILSVMQSNSALRYEYYMGTINILLVLEQQNPKVYQECAEPGHEQVFHAKMPVCHQAVKNPVRSR